MLHFHYHGNRVECAETRERNRRDEKVFFPGFVFWNVCGNTGNSTQKESVALKICSHHLRECSEIQNEGFRAAKQNTLFLCWVVGILTWAVWPPMSWSASVCTLVMLRASESSVSKSESSSSSGVCEETRTEKTRLQKRPLLLHLYYNIRIILLSVLSCTFSSCINQ